MKKEYDFESIGKRTPYRVPEGFFEEMQNRVLHTAEVKKARVITLPRAAMLTVAAAAAVLAVLLVPGRLQTERAKAMPDDALVVNTSWVDNMSDEDLAYMESIYECDIFMY